MTIRRFDPVRTANVLAVMYAALIVVMVLLFFVPLTLIGGLMGRSGAGMDIVGGGVIGALIFALLGSLVYAVIGWITTALGCVLYNFVAGRVGGIRIEVEVETPYQGGLGHGPAGYQAYGYGAQPQGQNQWQTPGVQQAPSRPQAPDAGPPLPPGWS